MDTAAEPPVGVNAQVFTGPVATAFSARRTPGLHDAVGQLAGVFQQSQV